MLKKILIGLTLVLLAAAGYGLTYFFQIQTCPKNYVNFPTHIFGGKTVCIAKYEMRQGTKGEAVSTFKGLPWTNINLEDAIKACKANGERYDLITNQLWTIVAREISDVPENWSSGQDFIGRLNMGHVTSEPKKLLQATSDDDDSCFETGASCSLFTWHPSRRVSILASTQVLWDFSGNALEWVKQSMSQFQNLPPGPYAIMNFQEPPISRFGPYENCDRQNEGNFYCGYGSVVVLPKGKPGRAALARGGKIGNGRLVGGVFTAVAGLSSADKSSDLGFRCTFLPLKKVAIAEIFDELNSSLDDNTYNKIPKGE